MRLDLSMTDKEWDDLLYSVSMKSLSSVHWSPLKIAKQAAEWLAPVAGTKVLDVGSGVGKFCIVGASYTKGHFTGVELRSSLFKQAKKAAKKAGVANVEFILADMNTIDFRLFDSFYFFNPFYENVVPNLAIDAEIELSQLQYENYTNHVSAELDKLKPGTRVVTFCSSDSKIPPSYELVYTSPNTGKLRFWLKH